MKTERVKRILFDYFMGERDCIVATEFDFNGYLSDVTAIRRDLVFYEIEIKTNEKDLKSELKSIELCLGGLKQEDHSERINNKIIKHKNYLMKNNRYIEIPNYFYFAIPYDLRHYIDILKKTPYGIILIDWAEKIEVKQRPKKLTEKKATPEMISSIARRIQTERANLIYKLKNEIY